MYSVKHVLSKIPQNPQKNTCIRVWFLIKLQTKLILKRDSRTDASPRILPSFQEHLFWRTSTNDSFWIFIFFKTRHVHIISWRILGFQHNVRSFYNECVMSLLFSAVYDLKDHIWIRIYFQRCIQVVYQICAAGSQCQLLWALCKFSFSPIRIFDNFWLFCNSCLAKTFKFETFLIFMKGFCSFRYELKILTGYERKKEERKNAVWETLI